MSSWIEDGRSIVSSHEAAAASEAIHVQTDRIAENETARQKALNELADVGEKFRIVGMLESIFADHWHLGRILRPPQDDKFGLTFTYDALYQEMVSVELHPPRTVYDGGGGGPGPTSHLEYFTLEWTGKYGIRPVSTSIWVRRFRDSDFYYLLIESFEGQEPRRRYFGDGFSPYRGDTRPRISLKIDKHGKFPDTSANSQSTVQLRAALSEICFNKEEEHSWPEQLQGVADAQIVKAVEEGTLNLEGVDPKIIEEAQARHRARVDKSPPLLGFWEAISSVYR